MHDFRDFRQLITNDSIKIYIAREVTKYFDSEHKLSISNFHRISTYMYALHSREIASGILADAVISSPVRTHQYMYCDRVKSFLGEEKNIVRV